MEPIHLAIIPDGNRRWAKQRGMHPWEGHRKAVQNFRTIADVCRDDPRVRTLTFWCFSTENWKRDPKEISKLMGMLEDYLRKERGKFAKQKTRLVHAGRKDRIPASLAQLITEAEEETKDQTGFTLQLALDYGGKDEIVRAIRRLDAPADVTEESFRSSLDHPDVPDIDLIVRTSGEIRVSNFFLWQGAYAEWIFTDLFFPDFGPKETLEALDEYNNRTRRFGGD